VAGSTGKKGREPMSRQMLKQPKTDEQTPPKSDRDGDRQLNEREMQKVSGGQQSGRHLGDGSV
jgi:hypothetical protein